MRGKTINNDELLSRFDDLKEEILESRAFMKTKKYYKLNENDKIRYVLRLKRKMFLKRELRRRLLEKMNNTY